MKVLDEARQLGLTTIFDLLVRNERFLTKLVKGQKPPILRCVTEGHTSLCFHTRNLSTDIHSITFSNEFRIAGLQFYMLYF